MCKREGEKREKKGKKRGGKRSRPVVWGREKSAFWKPNREEVKSDNL